MSIYVCRYGHDHTREDVAVSLDRRRMLHCPQRIRERGATLRQDRWTTRPLRAVVGTAPKCSFCFVGSAGGPVR